MDWSASRGTGKKPPSKRRAIFPLAMWSCHNRFAECSTRTTNSLEPFHNSFNSLVEDCRHPPVWDVLKGLEMQQAHTEKMYASFTRGETFMPSAAQVARKKS